MTLSRRVLLQATAAFVGTIKAAMAATPRTALGDLALWYGQPASEWTEALPIGNGHLGAMIFGGVSREKLQLNEATLWAGSPYQPAHKGAVAHLQEARALIFDGKYLDAQKLIDKEMMAEPVRQMSYQTIGSLIVNDDKTAPILAYRRSLDLETAIARVEYIRERVSYVREGFVSAVDRVVAYRLRADSEKKIAVRIGFETPQKASVVFDGTDILLRGVNTAQQGIPGKLRFDARARVLAQGGKVSVSGQELVVKDADSIVILIAAATNFKQYDDISGEPDVLAKAALDAASQKSFDALMQAHVADYRHLFDRVRLDLGRTPAADRPTDVRIAADALEADPALAVLYYQFARYLMISTSRPGTQAAGLQGVWNDKLNAPWGGKYTVNINTEMNYWVAESGNLSECVEPLLRLVQDIAVTGQVTAKQQYGARGWVCHHNTDIWRATGPIDAATYGMWPLGGAWLCVQLYDHYDYGRDEKFLRTLYPLMKGASQFFLDTLVAHPKYGWMVTNPSMSPEHTHPFGTMLCAGPAMDTQILRDLFDKTAAAAAILKTDAGFQNAVRAMRAKLAPDLIGKEGQLQEWLEDWDMQAPDIHHRHVSHLYGLFPSSQFSIYDTPKIAAAARKSLEIRGDEATGWGTAWRINLWARLGDGDHAFRVLKFLTGPERTYPDMFDAHPPFQIDGNFGGANGISELLLQSYNGTLIVLPALPKAWPTGQVQGLRARGGIQADIRWKDGILERLVLTAANTITLTLRCTGTTVQAKLQRGTPTAFALDHGQIRKV